MRPLFSFAICALLLSPWVRAADIRIVATDLLGPDFTRGLTDWAEKNHLSVAVKLEGSRLGQEALSAREADLGILVFAPDEPLPQAPFTLKPWAYEVAVVVVSDLVPVSKLSYGQLGGIFGALGQANVNLWGEIGAAGQWASRPISMHALTTAAGGGISLDLFRATVLRNAAVKSNVALYNDRRELLGKLSAEEGSLAILPDVPSQPAGLKVLAIARANDEPAFPPSAENVHAGDYPLRLPVFLVVPRENTAALQPLIRFLLSNEALPLVTQSRLMPLPEGVRTKQTEEWAAP